MLMKFVVNTVTLLLVIYNSFNAYKAKKTGSNLRRHYSYYFVVMGLLLSFDSQLSFVTCHFPSYQFVKLITVIWLSIPVCSGSMFIYKFYLCLIFKKNEYKIDTWLDKLRARACEMAIFYYDLAYNKLKKERPVEVGDEIGDKPSIEKVGDASESDLCIDKSCSEEHVKDSLCAKEQDDVNDENHGCSNSNLSNGDFVGTEGVFGEEKDDIAEVNKVISK